MEVKQIASLLNDVFKEVTGQVVQNYDPDDPENNKPVAIIKEDLSDIVTVGQKVLSSSWKDNYIKALIDRIGRDIFVDRVYTGYAPNVLMDSWEYGSIMAKYRCKMFEARENPAWKLTKGQTVNQFEYMPPEVIQKFYNFKSSWEIGCSFPEVQIDESFTNASAINRFIGMIQTTIGNSKRIDIDALIMRTINNFIAEKIYANNGVIDLLQEYNATLDAPITAAQAMRSKEFFRFAAMQIKLYVKRFVAPSALFNTGDDGDAIVNFTPADLSHLVLHNDFATAVEVYLQSDTYHDDLVKISKFETIPFWQSQGSKYEFEQTSRINVQCASSDSLTTKVVDQNYILGVLFDHDALGVLCENQRTKSSYNSDGEYYNNFYKYDSENFNDLTENGIVFVCGAGIPNIQTSAMQPNEKIWEYDVSDLQTNVKVDNQRMKITGTLKYITTGALPPTWGDGNFIALKWDNIPSNAISVEVGIENLVDIINDPDKNGTIKVSDTTKKLRVITTTPNGVNEQLYDLSGLTLLQS